jgi:hypothetical protein
VRIATDLDAVSRERPTSRDQAITQRWKMSVGAERGSGLDGFSRLDWPASEALAHAERMHNAGSRENSRLSWSAAEVVREARRARAEAMGHWFRSLLHELKQMFAAGVPAPVQMMRAASKATRRQ